MDQLVEEKPLESNWRAKLEAIALALSITSSIVSGEVYPDSEARDNACCFAFESINGIDSFVKYTASTERDKASWNDFTNSCT